MLGEPNPMTVLQLIKEGKLLFLAFEMVKSISSGSCPLHSKVDQFEDLNRSMKMRSELIIKIDRLFGEFDFLAMPSAQVFPFDKNLQYPNQINNENLDTYHRWIEVHILSSLLNLPTINVPIGFNKDGLPLGMQIIGKKYEDLKILTFAKRYEQIFVHSKSKPKLN